jgi:hypothetical protein
LKRYIFAPLSESWQARCHRLITESPKDMKNLNLLFIEGNRTKIDNSNVVESYNKIKAWGFIETMPIEYFPMEEAKNKLGGRKLYRPTITRKKGEGSATISNFEIKMVEVQEADYDKYDGVCGDGQHRTIALMFDELKDVTATYQPVKLSKENMDILAYISIRNNGRKWSNDDFYASNISTGDTNADYILNKRKEGYIPAFLFNVYTLGTSNLTAAQIKSIQQGYKKLSDFSKVQISKDTQDKGDRILAALESNSFISNDRFTGRFGAGLKAFFTECKDIEIVVNTINHINKENWNKYFTPIAGQSMEAKSYKEALTKLTEQIKK